MKQLTNEALAGLDSEPGRVLAVGLLIWLDTYRDRVSIACQLLPQHWLVDQINIKYYWCSRRSYPMKKRAEWSQPGEQRFPGSKTWLVLRMPQTFRLRSKAHSGHPVRRNEKCRYAAARCSRLCALERDGKAFVGPTCLRYIFFFMRICCLRRRKPWATLRFFWWSWGSPTILQLMHDCLPFISTIRRFCSPVFRRTNVL